MGVGCRPARAPERPIGSVPPESSGAMAIIRPRGLQHPRGAKAVAKMLPTLANRETHPAGAEEPVVTERRSLKSVHGGLAKVGATPGAPKAAEWRSGRLRPPRTGVAPTFCLCLPVYLASAATSLLTVICALPSRTSARTFPRTMACTASVSPKLAIRPPQTRKNAPGCTPQKRLFLAPPPPFPALFQRAG